MPLRLIILLWALGPSTALANLGGAIVQSGVGSGSIDTGAIGTDAVTSAKILNATIAGVDVAALTLDSTKLANGSVDSEKLAKDSVNTEKLQTDAVTTPKLITGAVNTLKLATDAVTAIKIINSAIESAKLAPDAVTALAILNGAIESAKLATDAVTVTAILNAAVQTSKLATDAVTVAAILNAAVETAKLATDAVTTAKIITAAVETGKLATDSVTSAKLLNGAVETGKLHAQALNDVTKVGGFKSATIVDSLSGVAASGGLGVSGAATFLSSATVIGSLQLGNVGLTSAYINSRDSMFYNIDSDNSGTGTRFIWSHNGGDETGTELMRLTDTGNLGIGTNPSTIFHVNGPGATAYITDSAAVGAGVGGILSLGGNYTGSTKTSWAQIKGLKENATDGEYGGYLAFYTRPNEDSNLERVRITPAGSVGIGTASPGQKLEVVGNALIATGALDTNKIVMNVPAALGSADSAKIGIGLVNPVGHLHVMSGSADTAKVSIGDATHGGCIMMGTTSGCFECGISGITFTCAADADCVCDGTF